MNQGLSKVFNGTALASRLTIGITAFLALLGQLFNIGIPLRAQVVLAIIALAVGIPHGAIDHLITIPRESTRRFLLFILIYTAVAILAGVAIATWNLIGFQIVLLMSALHFGFGDAAFFDEGRSAQGLPNYPSAIIVAYAIPAGFLPVILPLTDARTSAVLQDLNPHILNWAGSINDVIREATLTIAALSILILIITKNFKLATDLILLITLSFFAQPLVAFAIYFGAWHALRHTARLVPKLSKAMTAVAEDKPGNAFKAAITPGLYAIFGVFVLGTYIAAKSNGGISKDLLWTILVIIWALTVPHMATTARFDLAAFKRSIRP